MRSSRGCSKGNRLPRERELHGGDPHVPSGEVIRGHQLRAGHGGARLHRGGRGRRGQHQECTEPGVRSVADDQSCSIGSTRSRGCSHSASSGRRDHARLGDGLVANTLRMGMFAREGDRHHAPRRCDELAHPRPVPHRGDGGGLLGAATAIAGCSGQGVRCRPLAGHGAVAPAHQEQRRLAVGRGSWWPRCSSRSWPARSACVASSTSERGEQPMARKIETVRRLPPPTAARHDYATSRRSRPGSR